jgi:hypothetical protein
MKRQCLWLMLKTSLLPYHIEVIKASKSKKKKKKQEEEEEATAPQYPNTSSINNLLIIKFSFCHIINLC